MAHTPGEWECQRNDADFVIVSQEQHVPILVATVFQSDPSDDIGNGLDNANLIAAAPCLLEALEGFPASVIREYPDALRAIAKAKGIQP